MALENSLRRGRPMEALESWLRFAMMDAGKAPVREGNRKGDGRLPGMDAAGALRLQRLVTLCAVSHYNDISVVAASVAVLDACGLPTWPLRLDIAALRSIARHRSRTVLPLPLLLMAFPAAASQCPARNPLGSCEGWARPATTHELCGQRGGQ